MYAQNSVTNLATPYKSACHTNWIIDKLVAYAASREEIVESQRSPTIVLSVAKNVLSTFLAIFAYIELLLDVGIARLLHKLRRQGEEEEDGKRFLPGVMPAALLHTAMRGLATLCRTT